MILGLDTKKIFILGSGGFANELKNYILDLTSGVGRLPIKCEVYLVDDGNPDALTMAEYKKLQDSHSYSIMGSGKCQIKRKMLDQIKYPYFNLTHPKSVFVNAEQGSGNVIAPGAVVAPNAKIGNHVLCNYNCTIGHDAVIGDLSVIGPNASISGNVVLGEAVYVGAGASIKENIKIGDNATIGMGAVVINDVPANTTVVGNPASPIERNKNG